MGAAETRATMKIENNRPVASVLALRRGAQSGAAGFAPELEAGQRASAATGASGVASIDAILALQGEERAPGRRARQTRRGRDALDALQSLEEGLLLGRAPGSLKHRLEMLGRGSEATGDAELDGVLREIDTRVAVELAKLRRQQGNPSLVS